MPFRIESNFGFAFNFPFTEEGILRFAPSDSGVYVIQSAIACLYVGEADSIEPALLKHLRGDSGLSVCLRAKNATDYVFEKCPRGKSIIRQRELIAALGPSCAQL